MATYLIAMLRVIHFAPGENHQEVEEQLSLVQSEYLKVR